MKMVEGVLCVIVLAMISSNVHAGGPLVLEHTLLGIGSSRVHPTYDDYNNDGIDDFLAAPYPEVQLISGADGTILRAFQREPSGDNTFGAGLESIADGDNDGRRDFVIGDPFLDANGYHRGGVAYGVPSSSPSGSIASIPLSFRIEGGPDAGALGYYLGATEDLALISWADPGRTVVVNAHTGLVQARLKNGESLGQSLAGIGDVNGDGIEDFALGDGNVSHSPPLGWGSIYIFDGTVSTPGSDFVDIHTLPPGMLLAELTTSSGVTLGLGGHAGQGDRELIVSLGDPLPGNGIDEHLIVTGTPGAYSYSGGLTGHLLSEQSGGSLAVTQLFEYRGNYPDVQFGRDIANIGDVTHDGVDDLAILSHEFKDENGDRVGRVLVVDGAGILDGFDLSSDVIQEIRGTQSDFFFGGMRSIGDFNGDGRNDLLVTVLYNGTYGRSAHIYSVVPEPNSRCLLLLGALALLVFTRRHSLGLQFARTRVFR